MASLSRDDVAHVAHLARLGLTDAELGRLEGELNAAATRDGFIEVSAVLIGAD